MGAPTLEESGAIAVFSRPAHFVEWKAMSTRSEKYKPRVTPYLVDGATIKDVCRPIVGERWIYVVREDPSGYVRLVDELHLVDGNLAATPMEEMDRLRKAHGRWPERDRRPEPIAVGKSVVFARRLLGAAQLHYFFASRVRLSTAAVDELERNAVAWLPGMRLGRDDPFTYEDGGLVIPVVDPLTIALHLRTYYVAAAADLVEYSHTHAQMAKDQRERVRDRAAMILLADITNTLLDNDGMLANQLRRGADAGDAALYDFRESAARQIGLRKVAAEEWATLLTDWLRSGPIAWLEKAYQFDVKSERPKFFVVMAMCHASLSQSAAGRSLLEEQLFGTKRWDWVHHDLFAATPDDVQQFGRKIGSAGAEWLKEYAPIAAGRELKIEFFEHAFNKLYGTRVKHSFDAVMHAEGNLWRAYEWSEREQKYLKRPIRLEMLQKAGADLDEMYELKPSWEGAITKTVFFLDAFNLAFRLHALVGAFESGEDRTWAVIDFLGSSADLGKSALEAFVERETLMGLERETLIHMLGYFSAVVDIVVAGKEAFEAWRDGDYGKVTGNAIVVAGSAGAIVGVYFSISWMGPVALAVVGAGVLVKAVFGRSLSDFELFVRHGPWGEKWGENEKEDEESPKNKPDWSDTTYAEWKRDTPAMFRALTRLLCRFHIEPVAVPAANDQMRGQYLGASFYERLETEIRSGRLKMGWVPGGATLHLIYTEQWKAPNSPRRFLVTLKFPDGKTPTVVSTSQLALANDGDRHLVTGPVIADPPMIRRTYDTMVGKQWQFDGFNESLLNITMAGELDVKLADIEIDVRDADGGATLYEPYP